MKNWYTFKGVLVILLFAIVGPLFVQFSIAVFRPLQFKSHSGFSLSVVEFFLFFTYMFGILVPALVGVFFVVYDAHAPLAWPRILVSAMLGFLVKAIIFWMFLSPQINSFANPFYYYVTFSNGISAASAAFCALIARYARLLRTIDND